MITRPMKAPTESVDVETLKFPLLASPKFDGIRAVTVDGKLLSNTFKPIPNNYIRTTLERLLPSTVDGEIIANWKADWKDKQPTFQEVSSAVMTVEGEPNFTFYAFDYLVDPGALVQPFSERYRQLVALGQRKGWDMDDCEHVTVVPHVTMLSLKHLLDYQKRVLDQGYEGVMLRSLGGPYKCGRATLKEGYLLKLKTFSDFEAEVIGFVEQMENTNAKKTNELGLTKRSSSKVGKVGKDTLGAFEVRGINGPFAGVKFEVGTGEGLTDDLRKAIWRDRKSWMGEAIKYKTQLHGAKDKPRLPIFLGLRDPRDMG